MMRTAFIALAGVVGMALGSTPVVLGDSVFNGHGELQMDQYGYYYVITGGKFPAGQTVNGDNGSGGTMRYLTDDPDWGGYATGVWHKDDWFTDTAGLALTMSRDGSAVFDNNGIEDSTYGDFYNAAGSHGEHGLYRGYSMSNNYDWIYAGYFKLTADVVIDTLIGYFDANSGFDPNDPDIGYRMNIWSNIAGLLPKNTGGFTGDVLTSDTTAGTFAVSMTGVNRVFANSTTDPIWRLTYTLDAPITLAAGEYWFSHDAVIDPAAVPLPAAAWAGFALMGGMGLVRKVRGRKQVA